MHVNTPKILLLKFQKRPAACRGRCKELHCAVAVAVSATDQHRGNGIN